MNRFWQVVLTPVLIVVAVIWELSLLPDRIRRWRNR